MSLHLHSLPSTAPVRFRGLAGVRALLRNHEEILQGAEAVFLLGFLLHYIWVLQPAGPTSPWPAFAFFMAFSIVTHWLHRDTLASLGLRVDNLGPALLEAVAVVAPGLILAFTIGRYLEGGRPATFERMGLSFVSLYPWALFQQYGLQCFFGRRLESALKHPVGHDVVCAGIFAALHLPNPFLSVVTLGAGYCFCALFRRRPNLFALAAAHALSSTVLYYCLPPAVTYLMRVGPGYLADLRVP
jgi:hypothetical protein